MHLISKKNGKRLLKLLGPILFIFILIRVVDPAATVNALREIRLDVALLSATLFPVVNAALTYRWSLIGRHLGISAPFSVLFQIYYIGWFLSALPLAGISPLVKIYYLKEEGEPAGITAVSIIFDKLADILGLAIFGLYGLIYLPKSIINFSYAGIIAVTMLIAAFLLWMFSDKIWSLTVGFLKRYTNKRLRNIGSRLQADLSQFGSRLNLKFFTKVVFISIIIGLLRALVIYVLAIALNISVSFGLVVAIRAVIGIVNVIPITVSGLGTRDGILLLILPMVGVSREAAVALGFLAFLWTIISKFSGIFFWLKRPLPLRSINASVKKLSSKSADPK